MTAVARITLDEYPLLIGDILLSGNEDAKRSLIVPTIGNIDNVFPKGSGYVPSSLRQKVTIIDDNLALGWSGPAFAAKTVIKDIIRKNGQSPFTVESLQNHLNNLDEIYQTQGLGLVVILKVSNGIYYTGYQATELKSDFLRIGLLGGGKDDFEDVLGSLGKFEPGDQFNSLQKAVGFGLSISGTFLSMEIAARQSLLRFYGGGYEIATLVSGKFEKLDDITFVFHQGKIDEKGVGMDLVHVCKYKYDGDVLLIRSVRFSPRPNATPAIIQQSFTAIPPIYRDLSHEEIRSFQRPSFDSLWLCNYLLVPIKPPDRIGVYTEVNYLLSGDMYFRVTDEKDHLVFSFEENRMKAFMTRAFESYSKN